MKNFTYLIIDCLTIFIPLIFSFHPKLKFYKVWKSFALACLITTTFFIVWDVYFTHLKIWGFNSDYLIGITIFNLPIEEWLFFICIPFSSVFTYHCFKLLIKNEYFKKSYKVISLLLVLFLIVIAFLNLQKLYTSVTFIFLAILISFLSFKKVDWLARFYFSYLIILIPFFIVNGILTGSFLDEPVVWYNNNHNLGIRLFTIPFEDVFYGMLLLIMNTSLFEFFTKKKI